MANRPQRPQRRPRWRRSVFWVALSIPAMLALYGVLLVASLPDATGQEVDFTAFSRAVRAGDVESIVILDADNRVLYRSQGRQYWSSLPSNQLGATTLQAAVERGVPVDVDQQTVKRLSTPLSVLLPALTLVAVIFLSYLLTRSPGAAARAAARKGSSEKVTFAEVAGQDEAVEEIREVRDYLMHPERYKALGAEPPRGILLVGSPGTGKTLLARAVAGEAGVPFFSISGTEFVEMWVGVGAARVRDLFRQVRESAPAILFIDELDAAGRARSGPTTAGREERDNTLNQLLVEMDGFDRYSGVVLIGATNRPDVLDAALLRRGRFDRQIVVDRPDRGGRAAILRVHAQGKRLEPSVDLDAIATQTPGFTGADLASLMNEAALLAARHGRSAISQRDVDEAVDRVVAGNERRSRLLSPEEKRVVAYHEGGHAVVAWALPGTDPVTKISIVSRGQALGLTWMVPEDEKYLHTKSEMMSRMAVHMGGMAAEELVLGESTSGPKDDLLRATRLARYMVCELGMSESLGRVAFGRRVGGPYLGTDVIEEDCSEAVAAEIDAEVRRLTTEAYELAADVVAGNRALLDRLAAALVERETLRESELVEFAEAVVRPGERRSGEARLAIRGLGTRSAALPG